MSFIKSFIKRSFVVIITVTIIIGVGLLWFFMANEAPILKGKIIPQIKYKKDLTLDVYLPTQLAHPKTPVVVFIHGGGWIMGRKEALNVNRFHGAINQLRDNGYAVVSPEYTLAKADKSPFPDCIHDAFDVLSWVKRNAKKFNFDTQNIGVLGESAGAHIAMMAAYTQDEKLPSIGLSLNYVINVYGPSDLEELYQMPALDKVNELLEKLPGSLGDNLDITHYLFGFNPKLDSLKAKKFANHYSPIQYLNTKAPPTLIIHGSKDQIVPLSQALNLKEKLDTLQIEHDLHILENVDHAFMGASSEQKQLVQDWILTFIQKYYREK
ncbi:alpha/beta hydrolase, partial [Xanthovirga aplysinae]|uniref:alpha/beta hydrolase n=1 Tax=Xanthovirga aplysinae TaxID=2529853 RepID=UPI0012BB4CAF